MKLEGLILDRRAHPVRGMRLRSGGVRYEGCIIEKGPFTGRKCVVSEDGECWIPGTVERAGWSRPVG